MCFFNRSCRRAEQLIFVLCASSQELYAFVSTVSRTVVTAPSPYRGTQHKLYILSFVSIRSRVIGVTRV